MTRTVSTSGVPDDLVELGRIVSAYGVRGWVKLQSFSPEAGVLRDTKQWWLTRPAPLVAQGVVASVPFPITIDLVRSQGSDLVAQLNGLDDRDQAEALKGHIISVSRKLFPAPDEDEVYWVDMIGCAVYGVDEQGAQALIGVVDEVLDNGAHGVLKIVVQRPDPQSGVVAPVLDAKGRPVETLVPYVSAHIQSVDLSERRIVSDWPTDF